MRQHLLELVSASGVITRAQALGSVPRHVLHDAVADGCLTRVFPGVYALPGTTGDRKIRRRAALAYQPGSALSHVDALDLWRYPVPAATLGAAIHISQRIGSPVRQPGLKVHQRQAFHAIPRYELRPDSLVVVEQEQAIVESWTLLPERDMRAPMIIALRDGRTSARALAVAMDRQPNIAGLKDMRTLLSLVGACHSELELWGHAHVFSANGLRHARPQFPIRVGSRKAYLDRYFEEEMVDVEMDGAAYHGLPGQRERDIRRDAALARIGIQTGQREHECLPA